MTAAQLLLSKDFIKTGNEGCGCNPSGKAEVYRQKGKGRIEVRLYPKKKIFRISKPGMKPTSAQYVKLTTTLEHYMTH